MDEKRDRMSTISILAVSIIKIYKYLISPWLLPCCRFEPSCSQYAEFAIRKYGFFIGGTIAFLRIIRCNPFCKGGYDPVPEEIIWISFLKNRFYKRGAK